MGAVIKHTKEDIKHFRGDVCSVCQSQNICKNLFENFDDHIQYCPKFFNFMIDYKSFIDEQLDWEREHPGEAEMRRQHNLEISRTIKSQRRTKKKN